MLSRYYEHNYWTSVPELHDYINANIRLDPEHNDLPREQVLKIEEQIMETRVQKKQTLLKYRQKYALWENAYRQR